MLAGKKTTLDGAVARGRTLTLRLIRPDPLLMHSLTRLCAVRENLPADPEGARAPLPSAAPYYVSEYVPGERLVLERNRFYKGSRLHHVARFVADLASDFSPGVDQVASGTVDVLWPGPMPEQWAKLSQRYGVNKSQFFIAPGTTLRVFILNTSRPLLRNNVKLRQALNFAVDRRALVRESGPLGETPTDQYLLPSTAGYRNEDVYPLKGPDLRRARALAKGNLRGRKAVLYTLDQPAEVARGGDLEAEPEGDRARARGEGVFAQPLLRKDRDAGGAFRSRESPTRDDPGPGVPERDAFRLCAQIRPPARARLEAQRGRALPCVRRA